MEHLCVQCRSEFKCKKRFCSSICRVYYHRGAGEVPEKMVKMEENPVTIPSHSVTTSLQNYKKSENSVTESLQPVTIPLQRKEIVMCKKHNVFTVSCGC